MLIWGYNGTGVANGLASLLFLANIKPCKKKKKQLTAANYTTDCCSAAMTTFCRSQTLQVTKEFETGKVFPFASQQITFSQLKVGRHCGVKEQANRS